MSLCLNMIVKNESHIIEKTLHNICENFSLNYWVISDTGSEDNTVEIIKSFFKIKNIPGEIYHEEWKNFSHNRNLALEKCYGKSDYVLVFDADDYVVGELNLPILIKDTYFLQLSNEDQTVKYLRKLIIKNDGSYCWRGIIHEFLDGGNNRSEEEVIGNYVIISGRQGSRNLDPNKYLYDAEMLKTAFYTGEDKELLPRYAFYCAQSYKDAGMDEQAIDWYLKRINMSEGWRDEKYCSYEQLGLLFEKQNNYKEAFYYWQLGIAFDSNRAECWYHTARRHSWSQNYTLAYCFARQASELKLPEGNRLFLKKDIYQYWSVYEWCRSAYQLEKKKEAYVLFKQLLQYCPQHLVEHVTHQLKDYKEFIMQDSFIEVQLIATRLNTLNKRGILENILNN